MVKIFVAVQVVRMCIKVKGKPTCTRFPQTTQETVPRLSAEPNPISCVRFIGVLRINPASRAFLLLLPPVAPYEHRAY